MITEKVAKRCVAEALYILHTNDSLRNAAAVFGIKKSTLHEDVTKKLKELDYQLYIKVKDTLEENKRNTNT